MIVSSEVSIYFMVLDVLAWFNYLEGFLEIIFFDIDLILVLWWFSLLDFFNTVIAAYLKKTSSSLIASKISPQCYKLKAENWSFCSPVLPWYCLVVYMPCLCSLELWEQFPKSCPKHGHGLQVIDFFFLFPMFFHVEKLVHFLSVGPLNSRHQILMFCPT